MKVSNIDIQIMNTTCCVYIMVFY